MALIDDSSTLHRWTVAAYMEAAQQRPELRHTELIEGVIYDVPAEYKPHRDAVEWIYLRLQRLVGQRAHVAGSVELAERTLWDPDVYVERGVVDPTRQWNHANEIELVVEVAASTLHRDLGVKWQYYARLQIPAYWIVVIQPSDSYALIHSTPADGRYLKMERIELPGGHEDLPIDELTSNLYR